MRHVSPMVKWGVGFGLVVAFFGAAGGYYAPENVVARQSYSLIGEKTTYGQTVVEVQTPLGVSNEKMQRWIAEITAERPEAKAVRVNFYYTSWGQSELIAYSNGKNLTRMTPVELVFGHPR